MSLPSRGVRVSEKGAGDWADKLLPLPDVLRGEGEAPDAEIAQAFKTTGHFLNAHLARNLGDKPLPEARAHMSKGSVAGFKDQKRRVFVRQGKRVTFHDCHPRRAQSVEIRGFGIQIGTGAPGGGDRPQLRSTDRA